MTDAAIADTINRTTARNLATYLDEVDNELRGEMILPGDLSPWHLSPIAATLMGENPDTTDADRAWLVGQIIYRAMPFDGPADQDWENLFNHLRAEIEARRDPKSPSVRATRTPCGMV